MWILLLISALLGSEARGQVLQLYTTKAECVEEAYRLGVEMGKSYKDDTEMTLVCMYKPPQKAGVWR